MLYRVDLKVQIVPDALDSEKPPKWHKLAKAIYEIELPTDEMFNEAAQQAKEKMRLDPVWLGKIELDDKICVKGIDIANGPEDF